MTVFAAIGDLGDKLTVFIAVGDLGVFNMLTVFAVGIHLEGFDTLTVFAVVGDLGGCITPPRSPTTVNTVY